MYNEGFGLTAETVFITNELDASFLPLRVYVVFKADSGQFEYLAL